MPFGLSTILSLDLVVVILLSLIVIPSVITPPTVIVSVVEAPTAVTEPRFWLAAPVIVNTSALIDVVIFVPPST